MIIKSAARKSPSFGQLLSYMTDLEQAGPAIVHNLRASKDDLRAIHREFLDNYRYLPPRKSGNVLYHEILSFSDRDQASITPSLLEDLTRRYLELRAPCALAYAKAHFETDCPHVHIMISANELVSSKRLRLSRAEFSDVKRSLERYQQEQYPFLEHSVVFERCSSRKNQGSPIRQRRNESERNRRLTSQQLHEPSRKEQIRDLVVQQLAVARSGAAFFLRLKTLGLHLYRKGKTVAVRDLAGRPGSSGPGRRYRLSTLGLEELFQKALRQWEVVPQRLLVLEEQDLKRAQQLWYEHSFRDQIRDVMALHDSELSPQERDRMEQIRSARSAREQQQDRDQPDQVR